MTTMTPLKPWYQSLTLWGAVVAGASAILNAAGVPVSEPEQRQVAETLTHAGELAGLVMVVWGRIRARHALDLPRGGGTGVLLALASTLALAACASPREQLLAACGTWTATLTSAAGLRHSGALDGATVAAVDAWRPALNAVCAAPPPTDAGAHAALDPVEAGLLQLSGVPATAIQETAQ